MRLQFARYGMPWEAVRAMDKEEVEKATMMLNEMDRQEFERQKAAVVAGVSTVLGAMSRGRGGKR